jgi:hypothetical protein
MSTLRSLAMLMKVKELFRVSRDVDDKKSSYKFEAIRVRGPQLRGVVTGGWNESVDPVRRGHLLPCGKRKSLFTERRQAMCAALPAIFGRVTIPCSSASKRAAEGRVIEVPFPSATSPPETLTP